ncbi:MAG: hypothetical protein CML23_06370 [Rhizobiaceae bacterium]|jgi:hypothetical protein|uniref:DUF6429 domain-containing protein n=1 Tax=Sphingobium yanoikuyae TaxID=13690 RepID=A0A9X7U6L3_SPHYA|nr:DUF6429 family protein [Sphingobium yanoikuyae]MAM10078.1 hypothetical protein [Rhizobiaceae bacterium]QNG44646.1 hypothetical protein H3V42_22750 [Sphingobium yanoikuyae]|tara:strand:+ start:9596 stop:9853 length:258 start_codon:yes stop_codon:yes gene_type:complete
MDDTDIDTDRIDEAVLALMFLTLHGEHRLFGTARAWKSFDWDALDRLHAQDLILDPVGKAKSVVLTLEGRRRSEELFYRLFAKGG